MLIGQVWILRQTLPAGPTATAIPLSRMNQWWLAVQNLAPGAVAVLVETRQGRRDATRLLLLLLFSLRFLLLLPLLLLLLLLPSSLFQPPPTAECLLLPVSRALVETQCSRRYTKQQLGKKEKQAKFEEYTHSLAGYCYCWYKEEKQEEQETLESPPFARSSGDCWLAFPPGDCFIFSAALALTTH